jgi:RNA polymerase sigma factor (sigma-70 family)
MSELLGMVRQQNFEELFIDILGWDRLPLRQMISKTAPGQLSQGWLKRDERHLHHLLKRDRYLLVGCAQKRGQVVVVVEPQDSIRLPNMLTRYSLARDLSATYYEPLLIFIGRNTGEQVWLWPESREGEAVPCEHRFDPHEESSSFEAKLLRLKISFADEEKLSLVDVQIRLRDAFHSIKPARLHVRRDTDPELFREHGDGLQPLVELATEHRGLDRDEERVLVNMAQENDESAKRRLFLAHLYIALDESRKRWQKVGDPGIDLGDLVQVAAVALIRATELFDGSQGPRFQTYASLWVRRELDRALFDLPRLVRIPVRMHEELSPVADKFDQIFDRVAQSVQRVPTVPEVCLRIGLSDRRTEALRMVLIKPVQLDEAEEDECSRDGFSTLPAATAPDERLMLEAELQPGIEALKPKHRDVILLRFGLHPACEGCEWTLEETANFLQISKERARQIQVQAIKALHAHLAHKVPKALF